MELPIILLDAMRAVADRRMQDARNFVEVLLKRERSNHDDESWRFIEGLANLVRGVAGICQDEPKGPCILWLRIAHRQLQTWPRDDEQLRHFSLKATHNLAVALMMASIPKDSRILNRTQRSGLDEAIELLSSVASSSDSDGDLPNRFMAESLIAECHLYLGETKQAKSMAQKALSTHDLIGDHPKTRDRQKVNSYIAEHGVYGCPRHATAETIYCFEDVIV